jgi:hypothetical protein
VQRLLEQVQRQLEEESCLRPAVSQLLLEEFRLQLLQQADSRRLRDCHHRRRPSLLAPSQVPRQPPGPSS